MAKYSMADVKELIASDDFDILAPEFIARGVTKLASASDAVTEAQGRSMRSFTDTLTTIGLSGIQNTDPWMSALIEAAAKTADAQAELQKSISQIGGSYARVVGRM